MKLKLALAVLTAIGVGAVSRIATIPPYDPVADVGKVPAIGASGTIAWSSASSVTGAVVGTTGVTGNLPQFLDGTGKQIGNSGIPSANVVLVSRAVQAGTGLTVTNSGLLSADITMSLASPVGVTNGGTSASSAVTGFANLSPQSTKGDLIAYSTIPVRVAVGATGRMLTADSTATAGVSWAYDHIGTATGDTACSGCVGETLSLGRLRSAAVALTTGTTCNVGAATCPSTGGTQSITLTPGDWDCYGSVGFLTGTATSITLYSVGVSKTSATDPGTDTSSFPTATEIRIAHNIAAMVPANTSVYDLTIPNYRASVAANTTIYLVARGNFSVSTLSVYGYLECRRMR